MVSSAQPSKGALAVEATLVIGVVFNSRLLLTIRAVKVNRISAIGVVDESDNRLTALLRLNGRAWCHTIVTNESGLTQVWIDLSLEGLDINLIIVNRWVVEGP